MLNAYALFFGALLVPAGRFGDKYGRKNVFMLGLAVFTIASLACAVSPDLWVLITFRCVQAIGAALLIPSSLALVLTTMPPARVKRSVRVWAVSGAAAGAIGPVVGGLLTSLSWRWIFLINLPIGITAIAVTWKMIPNVRHDVSTKMPDPIGSLMVILTIGAISFGLLNGHTWGWGNGRIIANWAVAVVSAVAFVISTRRAPVITAHSAASTRAPTRWAWPAVTARAADGRPRVDGQQQIEFSGRSSRRPAAPPEATTHGMRAKTRRLGPIPGRSAALLCSQLVLLHGQHARTRFARQAQTPAASRRRTTWR